MTTYDGLVIATGRRPSGGAAKGEQLRLRTVGECANAPEPIGAGRGDHRHRCKLDRSGGRDRRDDRWLPRDLASRPAPGRPCRFSAPGSPIGPKFTSLRTAGAGVLPGSVLNSIFPAVLTVDRPRDIAQARRLFWRQESRSLRPVAANKKAQLVGSPDRSASADITSEARLTSSRSVLAKSSPIHKSGSPAREAIAYVQQSPKFKAAGCLPLPNRE